MAKIVILRFLKCVFTSNLKKKGCLVVMRQPALGVKYLIIVLSI